MALEYLRAIEEAALRPAGATDVRNAEDNMVDGVHKRRDILSSWPGLTRILPIKKLAPTSGPSSPRFGVKKRTTRRVDSTCTSNFLSYAHFSRAPADSKSVQLG